MGKDSRLRVGIVGCGHIARGHAMDASADSRLDLVAYADIVKKAGDDLQAEFGGEYVTDDSAKVINDDSLDIVVISTLHDSHARLAIDAAAAGRHILLEKPIATSTADALAIAAAVEAAGVKLAVNYKFRLQDAVRQAKAAVPRPKLLLAQLAMPPIEVPGPGAWVFDPVLGGGLVMSTGTHVLDLICWLADADVASVQASAVDVFERPHGSPDVLAGQIAFTNGSFGNVVISDVGDDVVLSRWSCQLYDGDATAILMDRLGTVVFSEAAQRSVVELPPAPASMLASLADSILDGTDVAADVYDGVRGVRLAEALSTSAAKAQLTAVS